MMKRLQFLFCALFLTLFIGMGQVWATTFTTTNSGGFSGSGSKSKTTDGITVTFSNGPSWQDGHVRVYQNNTISFSCSSDDILKVVMNCTSGARNFNATEGSCSTTSSKITWEGSSKSFTLTLPSGSQVRISSIDVTVGSSCTKTVTVTMGDHENGSFSLNHL